MNTYYTWYLPCGLNPINCVAAYKAKDGISYANSKANLANPGTYDAVDAPFWVPTWDSTNGWKFAGHPSEYLNTGILIPNSSWTTVIRYSNLTNAGCCYGTTNGVGYHYLIYPSGAGNTVYFNNSQVDVPPGITSGVIGMAGVQGYKNGLPVGATMTGILGPELNPLWIGDVAPSSGGPCAFYCQAFAVYNVTLDASQMLAVSTAMASL